MQQNKKHQHYRFCALYGFYFAAYIAFFSFYSIFLTQQGFTKQHLGIISTGTAVVNFASLLISGMLSDRFFSPRKILTVCATLSAAWGVVLTITTGSISLVMMVILPVSFFDFSLLAMLDAWTNISAQRSSQVQYSRARGVGNLSGAVTALLLGQLLAKIGSDKIVWVHFVLIVVVLSIALCTQDVSRSVKTVQKNKAQHFRLSFGYGMLLLTVLFLFLGWRVLLTYLPAMIVDLGGDSRHQGLAMATMSGSAMVSMLIYPKLSQRFGTSILMQVGAVMLVVRVFSMSMVQSLNALVAVQAIEAISYGLFQPAVMQYITSTTPDGLKATALSLYTAVQMALTSIVANVVAVWLLRSCTLQTIFVFFGVLAILGVVILCIAISFKGGSSFVKATESKN